MRMRAGALKQIELSPALSVYLSVSFGRLFGFSINLGAAVARPNDPKAR